MKLIIIAAGSGKRLWPLTKNTPKSLILLDDGTTILERQILNAVKSKLFNEIIIIVGYKYEQIEAKIVHYKDDIDISTVYNPFFDVSNSLISVWAASNRMIEDDFMITNGDNIFRDNVFADINTTNPEIIQLTVSKKEIYDEDDMKVIFENGRFSKVSKEIPVEEASCESVGLALVKGDKTRRLFVSKILKMIKSKKHLDSYWHEIFNTLSNDLINIETKEIDNQHWQEIDFHPDVNLLKEMVMRVSKAGL